MFKHIITVYFCYVMTLKVCIIRSNQSLSSQSSLCIGHDKHCYCDSLCQTYGDCCYKYNNNSSKNKIKTKCLYDSNLIVSCPRKSQNSELVLNCENDTEISSENLIQNVPVYLKSDSGYLVYKNVYCALCHGHKNFTYADVKCVRIKRKNKPPPSAKCPNRSIRFSMPEGVRRKCFSKRVDRCLFKSNNNNDNLFNVLCENEPTFYVNYSGIVYKNVYCLYCNIKNTVSRFRFSLRYLPIETLSIDFNSWCPKYCIHRLVNLMESSVVEVNNTSSEIVKNVTTVKYEKRPILDIVFTTCRIGSILSLIFLLTIYVILNEVLTVAGKVIFHLGCSILFYTIINFSLRYMTIKSNTLCLTAAFLRQYSYLCSFIWTTLFAVDLCCSMHFNICLSKQCSNKISRRLIIYCIVGYTIPLILSALPLTIQMTFGNNNNNNNNTIISLSPQFSPPSCFFSSLISGLVWLFIPLLICISINLIICIVIYRFLHQNMQQSANMNVRNSSTSALWREAFTICVRISIISGLIWLPSFIGVCVDVWIIKLMGGILSSLQGFLVTLCFIFTVQLRRRITHYFSNLRSSFTKSSSS